MQKYNKTSIAKTFAHTWYLYPITGIIITLLWLWGFQAFHQPSAHQKLSIFFATEVRNESFLKDILNKYDKEDLREITPSYSLPEGVGFNTKLQVAINNADLLILDEKTMFSFNDHQDNFFIEMNSYVKETYLSNEDTYYDYGDKSYGVLLKNKEAEHYLQRYMDFDESKNYYIAISVASKNAGKLLDENNTHYDNALTIMKYLISENR